jgi:hypothetical protein
MPRTRPQPAFQTVREPRPPKAGKEQKWRRYVEIDDKIGALEIGCRGNATTMTELQEGKQTGRNWTKGTMTKAKTPAIHGMAAPVAAADHSMQTHQETCVPSNLIGVSLADIVDA